MSAAKPFSALCVLALSLATAMPLQAQSRMASDFEMAQMEQQLARAHDFLAQLSGHLNLGDLRMARNETSLARDEYRKASDIATAERLRSRNAADLARYTTATSYAALAAARLGRSSAAFELAEESIRYGSDTARSWNLYASSMSLLGKPAKAVSASRNAVAIDQRALVREPTVANRLDLAVDQYALATSLTDIGKSQEAEDLLAAIVSSLRSSAFQGLQHEVVQREAFEVYSSARGDASAYVSLLNRSQLRLAALHERRGDAERAREIYQQVLDSRTDDSTALAALARLTVAADERQRYYEQAFEANPFSLPLIAQYQKDLQSHRIQPSSTLPADDAGAPAGAEVRAVLGAIQRGQLRDARSILSRVTRRFPDNESLRALGREIDAKAAALIVPRFLEGSATAITPVAAELQSLIALFNEQRLTPDQRAALDTLTFTSTATFDAVTSSPATTSAATPQTVFETGTIDGVPIRFSEPIAFQGLFAAGEPLALTYRVLGATRRNGDDALLLEPIRLEKR